MDFITLFKQAIGFLDLLKPETLEKLGSFGSGVSLTGQALAAALALLAIVFGRSRWAPSTPSLPGVATIGLAVILAAGLLVVLAIRDSTTATVNLWLWSFVLLATGLVFLLIYYVFKSRSYFSCPGSPDVYIKGLKLLKQARYVLKGDVAKLRPPYVLHKRPDGSLDIPIDSEDFFCRTSKGPGFVWSRRSVVATEVVLIVLFWLALAPLPLALFTASTALKQPDIKVENKSITFAADVLFEFNSDAIRPTAATSLAQAAAIIRTRKISRARIEGHTDGFGDDKYNLDLSNRRALAVKNWLATKEGLGQVNFETAGLGKAGGVKETTADGEDDPVARAKNRRVEIKLLQ